MRARPLAAAVLAGALLVPATALGRDRITLYPALAAAPHLREIRTVSHLRVLLPEIMHLRDLTDGPRHFRMRARVTRGSYTLDFVNRSCPKSAPCRHVAMFSARRTSDEPAGGIRLARGRIGYYTLGSCTGGGCTPGSVTWIERGARYTVYSYVGYKRLIGFVNQAIRNGPRR